MTRHTQALLMALLGAVLLRLAATDAYLRYVVPWMRWPLLLSGLILVLLAFAALVGRSDAEHASPDDDRHDQGHRVPLVTWLLVLPGVIAFVIAPPALGSYLAERQAGSTSTATAPERVTELDPGATVPISVDEFTWAAQSAPETLADRSVALQGFVSHGPGEQWFVTQFAIGCCAADAVAFAVEVRDAERPERDQWVEVEGVHVPGTGEEATAAPAVTAASVREIRPPAGTYQ